MIASIGDYGTGYENEMHVADLLKGWSPDFIITVGDNNYPSGAASTIDFCVGQFFHDYIYPYYGTYGGGASSNRFFPTLGNHDYMATNAQPYLDYFTLPGNERYYSFRYGPVELFAINSGEEESDGNKVGSVQAEWLRTQLSASTSAWKIVYFHYPPYSSGVYNPGLPDLRWPFAEWGASVVLTGHDHIYERIHTNNLAYILNGLGGGGIYGLTTPVAGSQVRFNKDNGAMRIEATESNLVLSFFATNATFHTNYLVDTLTLTNGYGAPNWLLQPMGQTSLVSRALNFEVFATGAGTLNYQWFFNGSPISEATNRFLTVTNVSNANEGVYSVDVWNDRGLSHSDSAYVTVLHLPSITQQPTNQAVVWAGSTTLEVHADGYGILRYQWFHDGSEIGGATNAILTLTNVQLSNEGRYAVLVTDDIGSILSSNATVWIGPKIILLPVSQTAVTGETLVFSAAAIGTLPMTNIWRAPGVAVTNVLNDYKVQFLAISNVQAGGNVTFFMRNAGGSQSTFAPFALVPDTDHDGIPDSWESANGFDPYNPDDALLDSDGDHLTNKDEYLAETNPQAADSALTIQIQRLSTDTQVLAFTAMSNKTYAIEFRDDFSRPWEALAEFGAVRTNRLIQLTNGIGEADKRFYRIVTPRLR